MNDLETLLRDSLQSAPMPQTTIGDPVATVERRAARARAFIAGGALAVVAVVTAAVVVPMQLTHHPDGRTRLIGPPSTQPPAPKASPKAHAPTTWPAPGLVALVSGGGSLWDLRTNPSSNSGQMLVDRLDPHTHANLGRWNVDAPATWLYYGLGRVWVTGGGDGGYPDGALQVLNPGTGSVHALASVHQQLSGVAFTAGHAWVIAGRSIWEVDTNGTHVGTVTLPAAASQLGIVATESGELWASASRTWLRIDPAARIVVDTVQWKGPMLGAAGGAAVWTYASGRLIALSPSLLHQGQSVAEGSRITVPGAVRAVASSSDGGLFVVAVDGPTVEPDPTANLYYLNERALTGTAAITDETPRVPGVSIYQLVPDDRGGVDYTDEDAGAHWTP